MTIAKKIALITGGNIHNEERETPLPYRTGVNERVIAKSLTEPLLATGSRLLPGGVSWLRSVARLLSCSRYAPLRKRNLPSGHP